MAFTNGIGIQVIHCFNVFLTQSLAAILKKDLKIVILQMLENGDVRHDRMPGAHNHVTRGRTNRLTCDEAIVRHEAGDFN